jgi:hypothetical protein
LYRVACLRVPSNVRHRIRAPSGMRLRNVTSQPGGMRGLFIEADATLEVPENGRQLLLRAAATGQMPQLTVFVAGDTPANHSVRSEHDCE